MKKKGLIISTVVMVVVLIASLTTATYAWFTASNKTEIKGFDVSVVSSNAVDIGMKKDYGLSTSPAPSEFVTGDVNFTTGTATGEGAGQIEKPGHWDGEEGLSATLNHNINWGSQAKAVGSTTAANALTTPTNANAANTRFWVTDTVRENNITYGNATTGKTAVIAANKDQSTNELANQSLAHANINGNNAGDYAHFILGVRPTKNLDRNNFVIMVSPTGTTKTLGVLASIHVAYRVRKDGATNSDWKEVDVYGTNNGNTSISSNSLTVDSNVAAAYKTATGASNVPQGSMACVIEGLDTEPNKITQVEVVIYMAGADTDCNDKGKTSTGDIKLFFDCADAKTAAPTAASVDSTGKLTMTGVKDATVEYQVDNGDWTKIGGTWNNTTFTSNALPESAKGKTIKVRQTETGKATSAEFTILADNNQWK